MIKDFVDGKDLAGAFHNICIDDLLARKVIIFCTFIPLFAFWEPRRVIGQDNFRALSFHSTSASKLNPSSSLCVGASHFGAQNRGS